MPFEHQYTCPDIDTGLEEAREAIEAELYDFKDHIENKDEQYGVAEFTEYIYNAVSEAFEHCRQCNVSIRDAAIDQVEDLENEVEALQYRIDDREDEIDSLEVETGSLNDENFSLKEDIEELQSELEELRNL